MKKLFFLLLGYVIILYVFTLPIQYFVTYGILQLILLFWTIVK